jgi:hypothetical protein
MTKLIWTFLFAVVVAAAVGCAGQQPIYNVTGAPITTSSGKTPSMQQVQTAILQAGTQLGWQITNEKPGRMTGRLTLRTHQAVSDIEYDTKSYSIKYRDSVDLGAKDGQIHRNYNGWVQNLDRQIRAQFNLL